MSLTNQLPTTPILQDFADAGPKNVTHSRLKNIVNETKNSKTFQIEIKQINLVISLKRNVKSEYFELFCITNDSKEFFSNI